VVIVKIYMEEESYVCISADGPCICRAQSASASSVSFSTFSVALQKQEPLVI